MGQKSEWDEVLSGVPQGTVSGPHDFIAFINDISSDISSRIRLFADDCIIYGSVQTKDDEEQFQEDLNKLVSWASTW